MSGLLRFRLGQIPGGPVIEFSKSGVGCVLTILPNDSHDWGFRVGHPVKGVLGQGMLAADDYPPLVRWCERFAEHLRLEGHVLEGNTPAEAGPMETEGEAEAKDRPKRGAPRMEEREDWAERCQKARRYERLIAEGKHNAIGAAAVVGLPPSTVRRIQQRMRELGENQ
ncbi:MAG: hypothetical protein HPY83_08845 [Anaerolineae bacterium]|nr:hypothetical protein [Anaerolineae bacterium]